jgi:hypothetical protein
MGRFGLVNSNIFGYLVDDLEENQRLKQGGRNDTHSQITEDRPPRTIGYGSVQDDGTGENHQDDASKNVNKDMHRENRPLPRRWSSNSIGGEVSLSTQQELPSLTGAFRSLENRSIVLNCIVYLVIYMTIAVVAYSFVLERWTIIDSLYFAVSTL